MIRGLIIKREITFARFWCRYLPVLIALFCYCHLFSQNRALDSLQNLLKNPGADSTRIRILNSLSWKLLNIGDYDKALSYAQNAKDLGERQISICNPNEIIIFKKLIAKSENNIGIIFTNQSEYSKAIETFKKVLELNKETGEKKGTGGALCNIGVVYTGQGNYSKAIEFYFSALKILEEIPEADGFKANALGNISTNYIHLKDLNNALKYALQCLPLMKASENKRNLGTCYNNIGEIYYRKGYYHKALEQFRISLNIAEEVGDKKGIAYNMGSIGNTYIKTQHYNIALDYFFKGLKILKKTGSKDYVAAYLNEIGGIYLRQNNYKKALLYCLQSLEIASDVGALNYKQDAHQNLSLIYKKLNDCNKEFFHYKSYIEIKDSIFSNESSKKILQTQLNYEFDKKEQASKLEQDKKNVLAMEELERQKTVRNSFIAGFVLVFLFGLLILRGYRQKQKVNELLEGQNVIIEEHRKLVEQKNRDITDSINYARQIQESILPPNELKNELFPDAFILYKPRDIVSGDFYWLAQKGNKKFIAAADCTGHGIPGAFMSMIGNTLLNSIVLDKEIFKADEILFELREGIIKSLKQTGLEGGNRDGMDISFCIIDNDTLQFAGANNPMWIIRNRELMELKADKQPVGIYSGEAKPFTLHEIKLYKNDSIYIFTDGYTDQFGGMEGKKFKKLALKQLLLCIQHQAMEEQKQTLEKTFQKWKGSLEQVDDVLVIGIRSETGEEFIAEKEEMKVVSQLI